MVENSGKQRTSGRPFRKGQSGNPGGRPKTTGLAEEIRHRRGHSAEALIDLTMMMAKSQKVPARTRLAAIELLLAYGWGRPVAPATEVSQNKTTAVFFGGRYLPDGRLRPYCGSAEAQNSNESTST